MDFGKSTFTPQCPSCRMRFFFLQIEMLSCGVFSIRKKPSKIEKWRKQEEIFTDGSCILSNAI